MELEMQNGGSRLFFDLFVALCNHIDDIASITRIIATECSSSLVARLLLQLRFSAFTHAQFGEHSYTL
ncbi:hypothetical protein DL98DRAFT_594143 [Cadophora sp. DSE1049]|nr:hypothetical protein DL98DRAFT_594143 [Cadophora sp. DSE1049]